VPGEWEPEDRFRRADTTAHQQIPELQNGLLAVKSTGNDFERPASQRLRGRRGVEIVGARFEARGDET
jgi:hypothetical protein